MSEEEFEPTPKITDYSVGLPDHLLQYKKTAAWRKIKKVIVDEGEKLEWVNQNGDTVWKWIREPKTETYYVKKPAIIGSGEDVRVLTWDKWLTYLQNNYQTMTLDDFKQMYHWFTGDDVPQIASDSKLNVLKALIYWYNPNIDRQKLENATAQQVNSWLEDKIIDYGEWGLGCPSGCGRFWTFQLAEDRSEFKIANKKLLSALNARKVDGKPVITCDRCGVNITLI